MAPRVFLAFFILTSSLVVGQSPKYALKGGKVSFKPDITELPDGILWKHNGNKVVEFNGNEEQVYSPFDKRITLGWVSAELQITDLRFEDSGEYELEVEVKKALHHRSVHKLEVIDTVAEPTISCKMNDGSSSNSSAELECSSESRRPQPLKKFEWSTRGNVKPGPKLRISLGDERDDEVYSCSVSNPLSSKTATFTAKDCYPDKSSSVALIASLVSIFLLLLIVGAGVGTWFCKRHHKACFAKEDLEKQSAFRTARGDVDEHEVKPLTGRSPGKYEMPQKGHVKDKRKLFEDTPKSQTDPADVSDKLSEDAQSNSEFTIAPETPAVDMDKQEEKPLTGRSPGTCDVNGKYVTPQKRHVKDKRKLFEDTPKSQTDEHKRTASPPSPPPSEAPSLDLNADADQNVEPSEEEVPEVDPSDSEKANEPDPAGVSDKLSEDAQSNSEFTIAPETPGDMDKQEEEPLKVRSPGTCDVDEEYETPQKGHVKDKAKRFGDRLHGEQTSFKKLPTENPTDEHKSTASPPPPPPSESPSPLDLNNPASKEEVPQYDPSDSEKANEPDPAGVSDKLSKDAQSDPEFTIAPETPGDMDKQEEEPLKVRSPGTCDVNGKYVTPQKGHVKDKRKLFEDTPKSQTGDMDKQEEEPLKVRSPGTCDVDEEYETPQKGHVKDKAKRFGDRLHGEQTSFKKLQTENPTDEHKSTASPPPPPPSESPSPLDLNNPASNDDRDADADPYGEPAEEEVPHYDPSDSEKANEPDPADVSEKLSKDAQSDPEFIIAPEMPEPEKKADDEEKPETSPAVQPHSPATKSSPNMALEDTAGEHEEASDQVAGGTAEENVRESDSSEKKVSDDSSEDELSSNIPEQRGSKTSLPDKNVSQEEANTNKDNQQETVKPVSEDDDDTDKEPDLYLDASQQPQSPTPTKPDNKDADTPQESPPAAHPDPDREEEEEEPKTSRDSDKSDGQSDKGEGETDEGKKLHGLKEEKPGNESLSEDK